MPFHYVGGVVLASFEQPAPAGAKGAKAAAKRKAAPSKNPTHYDVVFTNSETEVQIKLTIPAAGAYHDSKKKTSLKDV
ncbi:MAG: hypothetical protein ACREDR_26745, partial [Blastocatellia bacterium]